MHFYIVKLVVMGLMISTILSEPQYPYYPNYYNPSNNPLVYGGPYYDSSFIQQDPGLFRADYPNPSYDLQGQFGKVENRINFGPITVLLGGTTITSTITTTTTCTTSTKAISICSPSAAAAPDPGPGPRMVFFGKYPSKKSKGLFYNDEEFERNFFPSQ